MRLVTHILTEETSELRCQPGRAVAGARRQRRPHSAAQNVRKTAARNVIIEAEWNEFSGGINIKLAIDQIEKVFIKTSEFW